MRECDTLGARGRPRCLTWDIKASHTAVMAACCIALLAGCAKQHGAEQDSVRLTYPDDFVAEDLVPPREWPESEKQEYCRGYVAGWKALASRWQYRVGISAKDEGNWIECRKDASAFQQGFERGQVDASMVADMLMLKELNRQLDQGIDNDKNGI